MLKRGFFASSDEGRQQKRFFDVAKVMLAWGLGVVVVSVTWPCAFSLVHVVVRHSDLDQIQLRFVEYRPVSGRKVTAPVTTEMNFALCAIHISVRSGSSNSVAIFGSP